jgi:hypothetical protein
LTAEKTCLGRAVGQGSRSSAHRNLWGAFREVINWKISSYQLHVLMTHMHTRDVGLASKFNVTRFQKLYLKFPINIGKNISIIPYGCVIFKHIFLAIIQFGTKKKKTLIFCR